MAIREVLRAALVEQFSDRDLCLGTPPDPIAVFPANTLTSEVAPLWHRPLDDGGANLGPERNGNSFSFQLSAFGFQLFS